MISEELEQSTSKGVDIEPWLLAARPKTLLAGVAPVLLGSALAAQVGAFQFVPALLCLLFAVLTQIGCNYANDYFDHVKGVDGSDRVGFKRAVSSGLISPEDMKIGTMVVLAAAFLVGSALTMYAGPWLFLLGVICIAAAVLYTAGPYPLAYYGLGDLFVVIFFGFIAVMFTFYVQAGYFSPASFWVALGCGLLAANVRVINDARDMETDARAGKKTLAVRLGLDFCHLQYLFGVGTALSMPMFLIILGYSYWVMLPLAVFPWGLHLCVQFIIAQEGEQFNNTLVNSARLLLLYSVLFAIGILVS